MSTSSSNFESPEKSQRSLSEVEESSQELLAGLDSFRTHLDTAVREFPPLSQSDENQHLEDFLGFGDVAGRSVRQDLPRSRSAEDLQTASDQVGSNNLSATTSREGFVDILPTFSRENSFSDLPAEFNVRKTRHSIQKGLRSPLRDFSQGLSRRTRKIATRTPSPIIMAPGIESEDREGSSSSSGSSSGSGDGSTPQWNLFLLEVKSFQKSLVNEFDEIQTKLDDEGTTDDDYQLSLVDLEDSENERADLESTRKNLILLEKIPPEEWSKVGEELRVYRKSINKCKSKIQKVSGAGTDQGIKSGSNILNQDTLTALRYSAQAPKIELPTFSGNNIVYSAFKKNFRYMITQLSCPQKLWGTHLYNSLREEALEYVGSQRDWIDRYDELWETLDDKYANRWVLANDTIKSFICKPVPDDSPESVNSFFYSQIDALKSVIELKMTVEQVGVSIICQTLPEEVGKDIKQGLKSLYPDKKKCAFSIKDIVRVYNDQIAIKGAASLPDTFHSTLSLKVGVQQPSKTQLANNPPQHVGSRGGYRGNDRNRGRGHVRGRGGRRPLGGNQKCFLCSTSDHPPWMCQTYTDAAARRDRLRALSLCIACTGRVHVGDCPSHIQCSKHPGYNHVYWTCGGGPHPGKQEPSSS